MIKSLTGKDLIKETVLLPNQSFLVRYNEEGIKILFTAFRNEILKRVPGVNFYKIYDSRMKEWIRSHIKMTRMILAQKGRFIKVARDYDASSLKDASFDGTIASRNSAKALGCSVMDFSTYKHLPGEPCDERWVGMLIRRYNDGTLPMVLDMLNQVMKEFDAEEFHRGEMSFQ